MVPAFHTTFHPPCRCSNFSLIVSSCLFLDVERVFRSEHHTVVDHESGTDCNAFVLAASYRRCPVRHLLRVFALNWPPAAIMIAIHCPTAFHFHTHFAHRSHPRLSLILFAASQSMASRFVKPRRGVGDFTGARCTSQNPTECQPTHPW